MMTREDVRRYLQQQREMYGDTLYVDRSSVGSAVAPYEFVDMRISPVVEPPPASVDSDWMSTTSVDALQHSIKGCLNCPLGHSRTNFVFGSGNPNADVMVVGEAPGADEDAQGLPFVGRAGQLLTKILESVEFTRDDVFICNILKCRPPNNRKPLASETDECEPYLRKQIELVQPRYILALGLTAANTLLRNKLSMSTLRQQLHDYHGIPTIVTYHPAALLRNPEWKTSTWEDVKMLRRLFDGLS